MNQLQPSIMNRYIIPLIFLFAIGCQPPAGDEQSFQDTNSRNLENATAAVDSIGSNVTAWDQSKFDETQTKLAELKVSLSDFDESSDEYEKADAEYQKQLKAYEEERIEFLQARKEELKAVHAQAGASMSVLDELLADLEQTKKDPLVTTYAVTSSRFKDYFTIQGNLEAKNNALVYAEMNATVKKVHVEKGDKVSSNQLLITLDTGVIQKQKDELETSLALATDLYDRQKRLWDQEIGSELQYLEAKNRKESLEATLATLDEQMTMGSVRAPFSGVIDELNIKVGEMASPMMPALRIVNRDELYVEADVSERHFGNIANGNEVLVSVQGVDGVQDIPAHVSRVGSFIKQDNRTFQIRVDFDSARTDLIPNLVTDLKVNEWDSKDPVTVLPASMVMEDAAQNNYVWRLVASEKEDRMAVEKVIVDVGRTYAGETCILGGLNEGDTIIDKGARKVRDGIDVRIEDAEVENEVAKK
jgi:membrane fusion protein (multidrug efflux system)